MVGADLKDGLREGPSWIAFARDNGTVYHTHTVMAPDPWPRTTRSCRIGRRRNHRTLPHLAEGRVPGLSERPALALGGRLPSAQGEQAEDQGRYVKARNWVYPKAGMRSTMGSTRMSAFSWKSSEGRLRRAGTRSTWRTAEDILSKFATIRRVRRVMMGEDVRLPAGEAGRAAQSRARRGHGRRHCAPGRREANDFLITRR